MIFLPKNHFDSKFQIVIVISDLNHLALNIDQRMIVGLDNQKCTALAPTILFWRFVIITPAGLVVTSLGRSTKLLYIEPG